MGRKLVKFWEFKFQVEIGVSNGGFKWGFQMGVSNGGYMMHFATWEIIAHHIGFK